MRLRETLALLACIAPCVLLSASGAHAQMSEGERKAAARAAYTEGVALQDKGNPAEALARFEAAQKLFDAPTHLLHIAECQALTGKLVEASETYETLIRKPLGKDAPDAFVQAQEQGRAELAQLRQRIPTMKVTVKPDPQTLQNLQINVNDRSMPTELVGIARPVNPGQYKLTASATGWATSAPVEIDVKERTPATVDLVLQQGASGAVVVVPPPIGTTPTSPPASTDQPAPKPGAKVSPSSNGLLLGVRPGFFVPVGDVSKNLKFDDFASAGPGIGIDAIARVARLFLVGGTLELASLGAPNARTFPAGTTAEVSTTSVYAGVLAGIMPNVDKVTFVADAGAGLRFLSQTRTLTAGPVSSKGEVSYSGIELALHAGVSIPAGPIRIVPKAGLAFGQFSDQKCGLTDAASAATTCASGASLDTASHTILNVVVGIYYHVDFSKKSGSALGPARPTTALAQ